MELAWRQVPALGLQNAKVPRVVIEELHVLDRPGAGLGVVQGPLFKGDPTKGRPFWIWASRIKPYGEKVPTENYKSAGDARAFGYNSTMEWLATLGLTA